MRPLYRKILRGNLTNKKHGALCIANKRAPCFLFYKFSLKNGDLFFLTPLFLSTGSLFHALLDFETLFLQEFSKWYVKVLHFQKPGGVSYLKNVFPSYFVKNLVYLLTILQKIAKSTEYFLNSCFSGK